MSERARHKYGAAPELHEHRFDLQLGPDGHGRLFGRYEGYVYRCRCGVNRPDYQAYLDSFHNCPDCGLSHRTPMTTAAAKEVPE